MTYRVLLLQGGQIFCLTMKTVYVYVFRTASATVYCTVKQLTNDRRAEICARLQWQGCTGKFTMIVSDEQLHFYRLCGTSMYSNVLGFALRCLFLQTQATSYSFYTVRLLYTVSEKGGRPDKKPYPLPFGLGNPLRNLKSENSQDYSQKPQWNCTFMNLASVCAFINIYCTLSICKYCSVHSMTCV
jgi:hypothetical protein